MKAMRVILSAALVAASLTGMAVLGAAVTMRDQYRDIVAKMDSAFAAAESGLLENVEEQINAFVLRPGDDRYEWRRNKLDLWLRALAKVHAAIDPNVDSHDKPSLNIAPISKAGVVYDSGVDPSAIKDPAVRKEYEQRLAANAEKAEKARFQRTLERLKERWTAELKTYVSSEYSGTKADLAEIDALLSQQVSDAEFRAELRSSLKRAP